MMKSVVIMLDADLRLRRFCAYVNIGLQSTKILYKWPENVKDVRSTHPQL